MVTHREIKEHHQAIYSPMQIGIGLAWTILRQSRIGFFLSFTGVGEASLLSLEHFIYRTATCLGDHPFRIELDRMCLSAMRSRDWLIEEVKLYRLFGEYVAQNKFRNEALKCSNVESKQHATINLKMGRDQSQGDVRIGQCPPYRPCDSWTNKPE
jgi:hypothetical protein